MRKLLLALLLLGLVTPASAQSPAGPAQANGYPVNATAFAVSGTGTTSATATAPSSGGKITYICAVVMTEAGGTGVTANGTLTHAIGGVTLQFSELGQVALSLSPCLPNDGSAPVATTPTATAATTSSVIITGYQK
jgi:hypothetical protein